MSRNLHPQERQTLHKRRIASEKALDERTFPYVTLDTETFATLVGREGRDVLLFRVSESFIEEMGGNEWHGPVEWRFVREEGCVVTLELRQVRP